MPHTRAHGHLSLPLRAPQRAEPTTGSADIVLLGLGAIGRALIEQLATTANGISDRVRICAVVDRTGYVLAPEGLSRPTLLELCRHKLRGKPLHLSAIGHRAEPLDAVAFIASQVKRAPILIDATAADTHSILEIVLERGWPVVLANKVPLAAAQDRVDRLWSVASAGGAAMLHEATVGAGLPVIDTLRKLLEAGDRITAIEGCPSGTLGVLFSRIGRGDRFSVALHDAMTAGYTEPDPRIDLSGLDVARKALILARLIGFRGSLDSVRVQSLVPRKLQHLPLEHFLRRTTELDATWTARADAARERGAVLRYRARVTSRSVRVGLVEVPLTDPLSLLQGTDNQFAFTTARYNTRPLVITGPGAGSAVTASGVYNDLLRVIAERGREGVDSAH